MTGTPSHIDGAGFAAELRRLLAGRWAVAAMLVLGLALACVQQQTFRHGYDHLFGTGNNHIATDAAASAQAPVSPDSDAPCPTCAALGGLLVLALTALFHVGAERAGFLAASFHGHRPPRPAPPRRRARAPPVHL